MIRPAHAPLWLCLPLLLSSAPAPSAEQDQVQRFHAAYEARDERACRALWAKRPDRVLATLASDLDRALELSADERGGAEAALLMQRAQWGALAAENELGLSLVCDQVAAVADWDETERGYYRTAQQVHERAARALEAGDAKIAFDAAQEVVVRAVSLGDWWMAAQAHLLIGECQRDQGAFEDAYASFASARLLLHELGCLGDEYRALCSMAVMASAREADARGLAAARQASALHARLGALGIEVDPALHAELERVQAAMHARRGG